MHVLLIRKFVPTRSTCITCIIGVISCKGMKMRGIDHLIMCMVVSNQIRKKIKNKNVLKVI